MAEYRPPTASSHHSVGSEDKPWDQIISCLVSPLSGADYEPLLTSYLTLYFNTGLVPLDRFLIDGVIYAVLGKDTECRVVKFQKWESRTTVRLQAGRYEDLEAVAEVLYQRSWEQQAKTQQRALVQQASFFGPPEMLSALCERLERVKQHLHLRRCSPELELWEWDLRRDHIELPRAVRVFLAYATEDRDMCHQLERHLAPLKRQGVIDSWHAALVVPGAIESEELRYQFDRADIVIPLVSADFLSCDGLHDQLQRAAEGHAKKAWLLPVVVRPIDLNATLLEKFEVFPEGGKAVSLWPERDEAWVNVVANLRRILMGPWLALTERKRSMEERLEMERRR